MPSAATWMDLAIIVLSELSQTEKDKYHIISLIYGIFFKKHKNKHLQKRLTDLEIKHIYQWGKVGVR